MTSKEIQECIDKKTLVDRLNSKEIRKYERRLLRRKINRLEPIKKKKKVAEQLDS